MGTQRILISPTRIAVSRPGVNVISPPAISPDYLSVDSSFGKPLRLLTSGLRLGASVISFGTVSYGATYSIIPIVFVLPFTAGTPTSTIINLYMKWIKGSTHDLFFQPYNIQMSKNSFTLSRADGAEGTVDDAYYNTVRNWIYFVFPP